MRKKNNKPIMHVVHCIDTEGPLTEDISETFKRLENIFGISIEPSKNNLVKLQHKQIKLSGIEEEVAKVVSPKLLNYNESWKDIGRMLSDCMSEEFRNQIVDDFGKGWVYSWHCMDHVGYSDNPRRKDIGFGNVYRYYKSFIKRTESYQDEINWHYHPLSFDRNPLKCAANYVNSYDILNEVICRRIIDEEWFPTVNRPGFHTERIDIHLFLEQWIPFDYANNSYDDDDGQNDLIKGRFGDWRRANKSWRGYHPSHDDYQLEGSCRRMIFRCLNVGTRFKNIKEEHVVEALSDAEKHGESILAFANHDWRDIRPDVNYIRTLLDTCRVKYPNVKIKFSGANEAAKSLVSNSCVDMEKVRLKSYFRDNVFFVEVVSGKIFGSQPYLAIKTIDDRYLHDNFDIQNPGSLFSYTFDFNSIDLGSVLKVAAASGDKYGSYDVTINEINYNARR